MFPPLREPAPCSVVSLAPSEGVGVRGSSLASRSNPVCHDRSPPTVDSATTGGAAVSPGIGGGLAGTRVPSVPAVEVKTEPAVVDDAMTGGWSDWETKAESAGVARGAGWGVSVEAARRPRSSSRNWDSRRNNSPRSLSCSARKSRWRKKSPRPRPPTTKNNSTVMLIRPSLPRISRQTSSKKLHPQSFFPRVAPDAGGPFSRRKSGRTASISASPDLR